MVPYGLVLALGSNASVRIGAATPTEQALVPGTRKLIGRFEEKFQATIARVWGEEAESGLKQHIQASKRNLVYRMWGFARMFVRWAFVRRGKHLSKTPSTIDRRWESHRESLFSK